MSLTEMLVVTAAVAVLLAISVPAAKKVMESFDSSAGARALINAALSNARAMAMATGRYTGVRFQQDREGNSYMIFIVHDPDATNLANGYRAVEGRKPMRLPTNLGVMDGLWVNRQVINNDFDTNSPQDNLTDADLDEPREPRYLDATTFSIVFSSSGHVVCHPVRVRRQNSADSVFNTKDNVELAVNPIGMFYQDDYDSLGFGPELSRKGFILYDKRQLQQTRPDQRWSGYLELLIPPATAQNVNNRFSERISPYTGELMRRCEGQY